MYHSVLKCLSVLRCHSVQKCFPVLKCHSVLKCKPQLKCHSVLKCYFVLKFHSVLKFQSVLKCYSVLKFYLVLQCLSVVFLTFRLSMSEQNTRNCLISLNINFLNLRCLTKIVLSIEQPNVKQQFKLRKNSSCNKKVVINLF